MSRGQHAALSVFLAVAIGAAGATVLPELAVVQPAQAQIDKDKDKEKQRRKQQGDGDRPGRSGQQAPPPAARPAPPPPPAARSAPPPPPPAARPAPPLQQPERRLVRPDKSMERDRDRDRSRERSRPTESPAAKQIQKVPESPAAKQLDSQQAPTARPLQKDRDRDRFEKKETIQQLPAGTAKDAAPSQRKLRDAPGGGPPAAATRKRRQPVAGPLPTPFKELQKSRKVRVEEGGRRKVIQEAGRIILKENNKTVIRVDQAERFRRRPGAKSERRPNGTVETFYVRRDGTRVYTVVDSHGRLLRRYRKDRFGREYSIIDNRRFWQRTLALGILTIIALNLAPPVVTIPPDEYIVDYDDASDDDLYEALDAPPIERMDRAYSLAEILDNYELRARLRSINIDSIDFEYGSWDIPRGQYGRLERIARTIQRVLRDDADAVVLIAVYSDEIGDAENDVSLAQSRADAIANVLTDEFEIPPENLVAQGYGEPEPRGRSLVISNISGLLER
jgi:hypothetical protein